MFKRFLMKKMIKAQGGNIPEEQLDQVLDVVEKNPELFKQIGQEIEEQVKAGKSQEEAMMHTLAKHKGALQNLDK